MTRKSLTKICKKGLGLKQNLIEELQKCVDTYEYLSISVANMRNSKLKPGLPTAFERSVVTLLSDYEVCKKGDVLAPEQAHVLTLSGYEMAEFKMIIKYMWMHSQEVSSRWKKT
ncbi:hypothetical protein P7K49_028461 [Saguinus oedipus]|uniref:Large ribosomal subunit protein uL10-like insertion domain-containing protein n=1 Tax=Saguinus oedipus TaxID=9490 RepID=A0ABQ9UC95_SAGOE|nr:hypothetical protein P7K49_028461 [Saguinus oedipus]